MTLTIPVTTASRKPRGNHHSLSTLVAFFFWLQNHACLANTHSSLVHSSIEPHSYNHSHNQSGTGNMICPPDMVTSAEEVAHYCNQGGKSRVHIHDKSYQCIGTKIHNTVCEGTIDPNKKVPTCSQPEIHNCGDEAVYDNFNKHSHGPCLYMEQPILWHSSKCGNGVFSCWDPVINDWCTGSVRSVDAPEPTPICPPSTVYSIHEAAHYCSKAGLAMAHSQSDHESYSCHWRNGTVACEGRIDPKHSAVPPACSIPHLDSCDDLGTVCNRDYSKVYSCVDSEFECWDRMKDNWCVGQVTISVSKTRKEKTKPYPGSASPRRVTLLLILTMIGAVVVLAERVNREKYNRSSNNPNLPVDLCAYQAVGAEVGKDLELASWMW